MNLSIFSFFKKLYFFPFAIVFLVFFSGTYLDIYNDVVRALFEGSLTNGQPYFGFHFVAFFGVDKIIAFMYRLAPTMNWYKIFVWVIAFVNIVYFSYLVSRHFIHPKPGVKSLFVQAIVVTCLLFPFVNLDVTFWSAIFFALVTVHFFLFQKIKRSRVILLNILGAVLLFVRFDTSGLVFFVVALLLAIAFPALIKQFWRRTFPIIILTLGLYSWHVFQPLGTKNELYLISGFDLYLVTDGNFKKDISNYSTEKEKAIHFAIENHFFNDKTNITPQVIESMILPLNLNNLKGLAINSMQRLKNKSEGILLDYWPFFLVFIYSFTLVYEKKKAWIVLLGLITFYILLGLLVKVEARVIIPICAGLFLAVLVSQKIMYSSNTVYLFAVLAIFEIALGANAANKEKLNQQKASAAIQQLASNVQDNLCLIDNKSGDLLEFKHGTISANQLQLLTIDLAEIPLWPNYKKHIHQYCNCNQDKLIDIYKGLFANNDIIYYATTSEKAKFVSNYLRAVYQYELLFKEVNPNTHLLNDIKLYQIIEN